MNRYCMYKGKQYFIDSDIAKCANLRLCDVAKMCKRYLDHKKVTIESHEHYIINLYSTIDLLASYFPPEAYLVFYEKLRSIENLYRTEEDTYKKIIHYYIILARQNANCSFLRELFYFASLGKTSGEIILEHINDSYAGTLENIHIDLVRARIAKEWLSNEELNKCIQFNTLAYSYISKMAPTTEESFWEHLNKLFSFLDIDKSKMKIVPPQIVIEELKKISIKDPDKLSIIPINDPIKTLLEAACTKS